MCSVEMTVHIVNLNVVCVQSTQLRGDMCFNWLYLVSTAIIPGGPRTFFWEERQHLGYSWECLSCFLFIDACRDWHLANFASELHAIVLFWTVLFGRWAVLSLFQHHSPSLMCWDSEQGGLEVVETGTALTCWFIYFFLLPLLLSLRVS